MSEELNIAVTKLLASIGGVRRDIRVAIVGLDEVEALHKAFKGRATPSVIDGVSQAKNLGLPGGGLTNAREGQTDRYREALEGARRSFNEILTIHWGWDEDCGAGKMAEDGFDVVDNALKSIPSEQGVSSNVGGVEAEEEDVLPEITGALACLSELQVELLRAQGLTKEATALTKARLHLLKAFTLTRAKAVGQVHDKQDLGK